MQRCVARWTLSVYTEHVQGVFTCMGDSVRLLTFPFTSTISLDKNFFYMFATGQVFRNTYPEITGTVNRFQSFAMEGILGVDMLFGSADVQNLKLA